MKSCEGTRRCQRDGLYFFPLPLAWLRGAFLLLLLLHIFEYGHISDAAPQNFEIFITFFIFSFLVVSKHLASL